MSNIQDFIIEPLDSSRHRREKFDCGVAPLNDFLRSRARKEMESGTSACFVILPEDEPNTVAGYYTLSIATILRTTLPESVTKKLPRYNELPAILLGRLARDLSFKGKQIRDQLMVSVLHRAGHPRKWHHGPSSPIRRMTGQRSSMQALAFNH